MKRYTIRSVMSVWGVGVVLGIGLLILPAGPSSAAPQDDVKAAILQAQSDVKFFVEKHGFYKKLRADTLSEIQQSNQFRKNVWVTMMNAWRKRSKADAKLLFLDYPFARAGLPDFTSKKFRHEFVKGGATKEAGSGLSTLRELQGYLGDVKNSRSMALQGAAAAEDEWHKAFDKLEELKANLVVPKE
jgi:hypothetical protein